MRPLDNIITTTEQILGTKILEPVRCSSLLPAYITEIPDLTPPEDIAYLVRKGVFDIPDVALRNELLVTFVRNVHPYMPLLDISPFIDAIESNGRRGKVSLLLFHAVMFSSAAFIEPGNRNSDWLVSRKQHRQGFYEKAKILYNFDIETDRIVLIQVALLLTYWHEAPDDPKDARYWLEIGLSCAITIGLNCEPDPTLTPAMQRLRRRLWWCLYTRDQLVAFTLRQLPMIRGDVQNLSLLTLNDFEFLDPIRSGTDVTNHLGFKMARSTHYQKQWSQIFIEKTKFCTIISHVIAVDCSTMLADCDQLQACDMKLDSWNAALPIGVQYQPPTYLEISEAESSLLAYQAWLRILFLAAKCLLCRLQRPKRGEIISKRALLLDVADVQTQDTIQGITNITESLDSTDSIHYLPTTAVALLLPVVTIHVLNIRSGNTDLWTAGFRSFHCCLKALKRMGKIYMIAETVAHFLESAICGDSLGHKVIEIWPRAPWLFEKVLTNNELRCLRRTIGYE
ncbi:fungal-specific transcription factor domain-containing protein [Penicillium robsamsonii]|uniref:fungal-specific transcription factor domain-containing protein n=1 Tax=Penicillium robsamsonii TaxID=1792511 RepID=UPI002546E22A|nr:fungal-specific transcription factor domain-containing protein [Penicillium robsamsonii]KAJ5817121.1 fungal-specific transcription factor domain-containing protein [Penicillium robsamsonii]